MRGQRGEWGRRGCPGETGGDGAGPVFRVSRMMCTAVQRKPSICDGHCGICGDPGGVCGDPENTSLVILGGRDRRTRRFGKDAGVGELVWVRREDACFGRMIRVSGTAP